MAGPWCSWGQLDVRFSFVALSPEAVPHRGPRRLWIWDWTSGIYTNIYIYIYIYIHGGFPVVFSWLVWSCVPVVVLVFLLQRALVHLQPGGGFNNVHWPSSQDGSGVQQGTAQQRENRPGKDPCPVKERGTLGGFFLIYFWDICSNFRFFGGRTFLSFSMQSHAESSRIVIKQSIFDHLFFSITHFSSKSSFLTSRQRFWLEKQCSSGFWPRYASERH